jgi:hypothetical protein
MAYRAGRMVLLCIFVLLLFASSTQGARNHSPEWWYSNAYAETHFAMPIGGLNALFGSCVLSVSGSSEPVFARPRNLDITTLSIAEAVSHLLDERIRCYTHLGRKEKRRKKLPRTAIYNALLSGMICVEGVACFSEISLSQMREMFKAKCDDDGAVEQNVLQHQSGVKKVKKQKQQRAALNIKRSGYDASSEAEA